MQWFNNLKISSKLIFGFGILTLLLVVLGLFSTWQLKQVNDKSAEISTNWLPSVTFTSDMNTNTSDFRIAELQHILSLTEEEMSGYEKNMAQAMNVFNKNDEAYQKLISSDQERQIYNAFKDKWNEYLKEHDKIIALSRQNKNDEAKALIRGRSQQLFDEFSANLLKLVELNKKGGEDASTASTELYNNSRTLIIGLLAIAITMSILIGYIISNAIARPINEAVETAEKLSRGELPQSMKMKSNDEVGRLIESMNTMTDYLRNMARVADSIAKGNLTVEVNPQSSVDVFGNTFKTMLDSLRTIIRELRENSHTLSSAAGELVAVSTNQSAVITEQASSIQEISTTLDEIRATVEQASDRAKSVAHVSEQSLEISKTGQQELEQVVGAMSKIKDQVETIAENILDLSEKTIQIGEITSSVNDIAEQSN
ncbi:MAG: MCP four helix bundle domain-containing protein, partial [Acidobacteria bacterium]|nr:MCP four helix bundle domain-containing protein [Acidobacteriota bacterium]